MFYFSVQDISSNNKKNESALVGSSRRWVGQKDNQYLSSCHHLYMLKPVCLTIYISLSFKIKPGNRRVTVIDKNPV
ncbi:hypothetical protein ACFWDG_23575, partial [Peribacillus sp. NPDC060186]